MNPGVLPRGKPVGRWIVPIVLVGGWLIAITSRQVALFPPAPTLPSELVPIPIAVGLLALASAFRVARPVVAAHVAFLVGLTFCLALLAAQIGQPLANATADECGDQCRSAIFSRFIGFFGWPVLAGIVLVVLARAEARAPDPTAAERAAWTQSWAVITFLTGMTAAVAWWRIILPNG